MAKQHVFKVGDLKGFDYLIFRTQKSSNVDSIGIKLTMKIKDIISKRDSTNREHYGGYFLDVYVTYKSDLNKTYSYPLTLRELDDIFMSKSLGQAIIKIKNDTAGNSAVGVINDYPNENGKYVSIDSIRETGDDIYINKSILSSTPGYMAKAIKPLSFAIKVSANPIYSF